MLPDSMNVGIIADNIRELQKEVCAIPAGKIPKDFSADETDTGLKWIDGKEIFRCVVTIPKDEEAQSPISKTVSLSDFDIGEVLHIYGTVNQGDRYYYGESDYRSANYFTNTEYDSGTKTVTNTAHFSTGYYGGAIIVIEYTKPTPTPGNETKKKTSKKGE